MGGLVPATAFFNQLVQLSPFSQAFGLTPILAGGAGSSMGTSMMPEDDASTREALRFILSPQGAWFREFVLDEVVKSVDALSREQLLLLVQQLGLQAIQLPILVPGSKRSRLPLAPTMTEEDRQVVGNVAKIVSFLTRGQSIQAMMLPGAMTPAQAAQQRALVADLLPVLPTVATEVLPDLVQKLASRIGARLVRELYM